MVKRKTQCETKTNMEGEPLITQLGQRQAAQLNCTPCVQWAQPFIHGKIARSVCACGCGTGALVCSLYPKLGFKSFLQFLDFIILRRTGFEPLHQHRSWKDWLPT